jgi:hypothetical protein
MKAKIGTEKSSRIATAVSLVALLVSIASAYYSSSLSRDVVTSQMIHEAYNTFNELHRLQLDNSRLSHLFVLTDRYYDVSKEVENAVASTSPDEKANLRLKERAIATLIFIMYEESYYQWKQARDAGDRNRAAFLSEVLGYLTGRLLRNPRLLFFWSPTGGGLATYFEADTRAHYDHFVLHDKSNPLTLAADVAGPFTTSPTRQAAKKTP